MFSARIEDVISGHSAVSSVAVIGAPDEKWGEAVTAVVVLKPDTQCDPEELRALVNDKGCDLRQRPSSLLTLFLCCRWKARQESDSSPWGSS